MAVFSVEKSSLTLCVGSSVTSPSNVPADANTFVKVTVVTPYSGSSLTCWVSVVWPFPGFHSTRKGPVPALPLFSIATSIVDGLPLKAGSSATCAILRFASGASTVYSFVLLENSGDPPDATALKVAVTNPFVV